MLRKAVSGSAAFSTAGTVFCGVFVQAIPFLALGVVVSGLIAVFVSPERLARWLPRRPAVAVLAAGIGGAVLPGCECGSVPVGRRLFGEQRGDGRGGFDIHAGRSGHQPGGAGRHRGGVSRCADDGCCPGGGVAADGGDHGLGVGAVGPPGVGHPPVAPLGRRHRIPLGAIRRGGPPRLPSGRVLSGLGCRRGGRPARGGAAVGVRPSGGAFDPGCGGDGRPCGGVGVVFGGRRVRGGQHDDGAVAAPPRVSGRRPGRRCEAVRDAGGHVRPGFRGALRPGHLAGRGGQRMRGRAFGSRWSILGKR